MADFLSKAVARNSETIELLGEQVEIRGLSIGELVEVTRPKKGEEAKDNVTLSCELISRCCYRPDGKQLIPEDKIPELRKFQPAVFNALNDAVTRVNGTIAGNSKATGKGGRHSV